MNKPFLALSMAHRRADAKGFVYIVDDDANMRLHTTRMLRAAHFQATPFATGADFLESLEFLSPGVVLLEHCEAKIDDVDVQAQLIDQRSDIPVIIMAANADIPTAVYAIKHGAIDFIEKPFSDEHLLNILTNVMSLLEQRIESQARHADFASRFALLTPREWEIMDALLESGTNKIAARNFNLSTRTIEMHRANIMRKLGARKFIDVIHLAMAAEIKTSIDHP
ncbi:MAG: response regulator [Sphingobium sp.]